MQPRRVSSTSTSTSISRSSSNSNSNSNSNINNTSTDSEKMAPELAKCYDEIDQIYDYIRGLTPLPVQLRKIKSIDFEQLERQQQQQQQSQNATPTTTSRSPKARQRDGAELSGPPPPPTNSTPSLDQSRVQGPLVVRHYQHPTIQVSELPGPSAARLAQRINGWQRQQLQFKPNHSSSVSHSLSQSHSYSQRPHLSSRQQQQPQKAQKQQIHLQQQLPTAQQLRNNLWQQKPQQPQQQPKFAPKATLTSSSSNSSSSAGTGSNSTSSYEAAIKNSRKNSTEDPLVIAGGKLQSLLISPRTFLSANSANCQATHQAHPHHGTNTDHHHHHHHHHHHQQRQQQQHTYSKISSSSSAHKGAHHQLKVPKLCKHSHLLNRPLPKPPGSSTRDSGVGLTRSPGPFSTYEQPLKGASK